ncbi:hypothetical protein V492_05531 [Pseudogymnoascus sp. VKM F-4246]|nr:hypothetical protein V492_05531 [Pseudogymnoascus sp. VKM F-4246]
MDADDIDFISGATTNLDINNGVKQPPPLDEYGEVLRPAPRIHSSGVVAVDITDVFTKAAEGLEVGELVKDDYFTLFESVGAIEIMDPKMDTGYLAKGETMEDSYDIWRELLPEECLGIIDQLLCLEMAWHMGHPLSQTLFTSLYIDKILTLNLQNVEDLSSPANCPSLTEPLTLRVLVAYCIAVIKTCWHINERVKSEHFYEEEDFVTHTYNRSLLDELDDASITKFTDVTIHLLAKSDSMDSRIKEALIQRLKCRNSLLNTVGVAGDRSSPEPLLSAWSTTLELLPGIKSERELAKPVPDSFSVKLQRKLASTVPPRPVVTIAFDDAYQHLERLCKDGLVVSEVLDFHDTNSLMNFVFLFQKSKPQPSVYIRTLLQHYLFCQMVVLGQLSLRSVLDEDLSALVLPANPLLDAINDEIEVPQDPRHQMAQHMEIFRIRAAQSYLDILRALCQNRCRIRRTLHHTIVDWDTLQLDAEEIDAELRDFTKEKPIVDPDFGPEPIYSFPLSSWSYYYKLRQMEWLVQMGFELEVYAADELAGMYWYLQNISQTTFRHLQRIRGFLSKDYAELHRNPKQENFATKSEAFAATMSHVNISMLSSTAKQALANSVGCLYTVLMRYNLIPLTPHPYSTDAIRYEQRMKSFLAVSLPEFLPFPVFQEVVSQPHETSVDLLTFASDAVAKARKDFELLSKLDAKTAKCMGKWCDEAWHKNVKDELKSCISVSIALMLVKKAVVEAEKTKSKTLQLTVEIESSEKGYHDWWVVPKVTPIK